MSAKKRIEGRQGEAETFVPVALAHGNDPAFECSAEELERTRAVRRKLRTRGERAGE